MRLWYKKLLITNRLPLIILLNLFLGALSLLLALTLRFDRSPFVVFGTEKIVLLTALLLLVRSISYQYFGLNQGYWRYSSTHDLTKLIRAHFLSSLLFVAAVMLLGIQGFPRSVVFIEFVISVFLSGGSRLAVRLFCEQSLSNLLDRGGDAREVIIIGAGDSGHLVVRNLLSQKRLSYKPIMVLDDSEHLLGGSVYGVPVAGRCSDLSRLLTRNPHVVAVIAAIPSLSDERLEELRGVCKSFDIPFKKLQSFEDIACVDASFAQESVSIESVLEKEIRVDHEDEIRSAICGKRILVTGAGGSIGSEIVRQIAPFNPAHITLLDNSELNLFKIDLELNRLFPSLSRRNVLATIKDRARLERVLSESRPEIVFHAAAFKHVPLIESNCYEAFYNNVIGTRQVLEACAANGVSRFILISTDKAVSPSSVMGCSKRLAEMVVQEVSSNYPNLSTAIVRFGNVINSNGSVIPLWKEQLQRGGPLTVTHPDMQRFFLSIREAVRLVLTAGVLGKNGEVYVLDMGKQIRVLDVAKKMAALYGRRDVPIVFTGVRPGEKLTEELNDTSEVLSPTAFRKVNRISNGLLSSNGIGEWIDNLEKRLGQMSDAEIKEQMMGFVSSAYRSAEQRVAQGSRGLAAGVSAVVERPTKATEVLIEPVGALKDSGVVLPIREPNR